MNKNTFLSGLWFKASDAEVKRQVEYYRTLKPWQSFRGISALLIVLSIVLTAVMASLGLVPFPGILLDLILMAVLAVFVYRGSKIAIILAAVYWTASKVLLIADDPSRLLLQGIWWLLFVSYFYKTWQVEKARSMKDQTQRVL